MHKLTDNERQMLLQAKEEMVAGKFYFAEDVFAEADEKIRVAKLRLGKSTHAKKIRRPALAAS